jgi:hypothetical protein
MVSLRPLVLALALAAPAWPGGATARADDAGDEVRAALERGRFPWYDASRDEARPLWPPGAGGGPTESSAPAVQSLGMLAWALGLAGAVVLIAWAVRRTEPRPPDPVAPGDEPGLATRVGDLPMPPGLGLDLADPRAEAARRRASGDLAGAIVALCVHQLVTLDRLGLSRLAPGKTARQVVRGVADRRVRRAIEPTLRLFEAFYYGQQPPEPPAFEAAWAAAESLERSWPAGVAS